MSDTFQARAFVLRTAPCFTVAAVPASIAIAKESVSD
jgi:hypothetical protein